MKKLMVFSLFLFVGLSTTYAQSAKKSCAATCAKSGKKCTKGAKASTTATLESQDPQTLKAAIIAAEADDMIEHKKCATSGKVSFAKKSVCPASGKVSFSEVAFEPATGAFVNVAPSEMKDGKKSCSAKSAKKCTKSAKACKGAKASTTATLESQDPQTLKAAMAAAEADENIEQKTCATTGKVCFAKKSVCATSGKVSYSEVAFEPATGAFVNVAPSEMKDGKKSCSATSAKKCTKSAKACKGAKASTTATLESQNPQTLKAAMAAAEADENIEQKTCATTGKVCFAKKSVCATSGKVSYSEVAFEPATGAFVNVAPSEMKDGKKSCSAKSAKKCTKSAKACKGAKASTTATLESQNPQTLKAAMAAAEADENIEQKTCATTGKVCFAKKSVCATSGKVSYSEVAFEPATGAFVNVAPSKMKMDNSDAKPVKACCAATQGKCCAAKTKSTEKVELEVQKAEKVKTPAKMKMKKASYSN